MNQHKLSVLITFLTIFAFLFSGCHKTGKSQVSNTADGEKEVVMVIHGGAGTMKKSKMTPEKEQAYHNALQAALKTGQAVLANGGSSLDAIEAAIRLMEDSPLFNAGKGAVFTNTGHNELDASIMDGSNRNAGAVGGMRKVKNPITAARRVMENSDHVMFTGSGADDFAEEQGLELVDSSYYFTQRRWDALQKKLQEEKEKEKDQGCRTIESIFEKFGTVGAVALDKYGNLAAGTSTGGMTNKRYGRVGDSPIIGAGTYANNATCAVSCTGHGEYYIRNVIAYDVSALMEYAGLSVEEATHKVIHEKLEQLEGTGGVIALDKDGNIAMTFNTEGMYRGFVKGSEQPQTFLYR